MASPAPPSSTTDAKERRSSAAIVHRGSEDIAAQAIARRAQRRRPAFPAAFRCSIGRSRRRRFKRARRRAGRVGGVSERVCGVARLLCGEDRGGAAGLARERGRRRRAGDIERADGCLARTRRTAGSHAEAASEEAGEAGEAGRKCAAERREPKAVVIRIPKTRHSRRVDQRADAVTSRRGGGVRLPLGSGDRQPS
jgi:hypothetical protein